MIHEALDIARWKAEFPLSGWREDARRRVLAQRARVPHQYPTWEAVERHIEALHPGGECITSPYHIAMIEQLRESVPAAKTLTPAVLTDVFVFGRGEPARREVTKIGGLPYWPAGRPWPHGLDGAPLTFVAQICFADSVDLVGRLPGDVLLLFASASGGWWSGDEDDFHCAWVRLGETNLISAAAVPDTGWQVAPRYGVLHRTVDYPGAERVFSQYRQPERIAVLEGTKIGGVPHWMQLEVAPAGRPLCSLGSINAVRERPYPYVNDPAPLAWDDPREEGVLLWGDMGTFNLFVDARNRVSGSVQFY